MPKCTIVKEALWLFSRCSTGAPSSINTYQGDKGTGAKVNIDLEQLEPLRAFQVCAALLSRTNNSNNNTPRSLLSRRTDLCSNTRNGSHTRSFVWLLLFSKMFSMQNL